jgi:hypothetical protein
MVGRTLADEKENMATRAPRQKRLVAVISLPDQIVVNGSVIGLAARSRIADVPVGISFPRVVPDHIFHEPHGRLGMPEGHRPALPSVLATAVRDDWGYAKGTDIYAVRALQVSLRYSLSPDNNPLTAPETKAVAFGIAQWFSVINAWLCAWHGMPAHLPSQDRGTTLHFTNRDGTLGGLGGNQSSTIVSGHPAATAEQIRRALSYGSQARVLPLEHQLLLDARTQLWAGDHRRAVIDACTASEVALAAAIRVALTSRKVAPSFQELTLKAANGVAGLIDLYAAIVGVPPVSKRRAADRLAGKRNDAAHAGLPLSADDARTAVEVAAALVGAARPLPSP